MRFLTEGFQNRLSALLLDFTQRTTQIFILPQKHHFICSKVLCNYDQTFFTTLTEKGNRETANKKQSKHTTLIYTEKRENTV